MNECLLQLLAVLAIAQYALIGFLLVKANERTEQ